VKSHCSMRRVRDGVLFQSELEGNQNADHFAKLGASFGAAAESDVFFLEGCLEVASQACKFGARMATRCVNESIQDHQGLEAIRLIDFGTVADSFSAAVIDQAYRDSEAPPEPQGPPPSPPADPPAAPAAARGMVEAEGSEEAEEVEDAEAFEDEGYGLGDFRPSRVRNQSVLEARVPGSEPLLFCTTCYHFAAHVRQRGLCEPCKGPRRLKGGQAYTSRKRLRGRLHPNDPDVALDEPRTPCEATRARWAVHFGVDLEGGDRAPSRLPPFSRQGAAPRLDFQACLKAFGFEDRAQAEALGSRAVQARAEAQARKARGTGDSADEGELG